jgi:hypothetical protein
MTGKTIFHVVIAVQHAWPPKRDYPIAVAPSAEIAAHVADLISACSVHQPGRSSRDERRCFRGGTMLVRPPHAPDLPDDAMDWGPLDADAWFTIHGRALPII